MQIVEVNSELVYKNESGGLNEAFADMTGKVAETYILRQNEPENWKVGDEISKDADKVLRYMEDPTADGHSLATYADFVEGTDVHYSSGIMNKAFALLAQKPSFTIWEAYDVFFLANMFYWRSTTDFLGGAEGALRTLCEMRAGKLMSYDYSHLEPSEALEAFQSVGMDCADMEQSCKFQCTAAS